MWLALFAGLLDKCDQVIAGKVIPKPARQHIVSPENFVLYKAASAGFTIDTSDIEPANLSKGIAPIFMGRHIQKTCFLWRRILTQ